MSKTASLKVSKILPTPIKLVMAIDKRGGISKNGAIPWNLLKDREFFKHLIQKPDHQSNKYFRNAVIMGRKTFNTLQKPLHGCTNIIITNKYYHKLDQTINNTTIIQTAKDLSNALSIATPQALSLAHPDEKYMLDSVFICGGSSIYNEAIKGDIAKEYYITWIKDDYNCDNCVDIDALGHTIYDFKQETLYEDNTMEIKKYYY